MSDQDDREALRDFALKAFPVGLALGAGAVYGLLILAYSEFQALVRVLLTSIKKLIWGWRRGR